MLILSKNSASWPFYKIEINKSCFDASLDLMLFWIRILKILAIIFAPKKTKYVRNFARFAMQFQFFLCLPMQTKITQRNQGRNPTYFLYSFLLLWPLKAKMKIESDIATSTLSFLIKSFLCNWIILPAISCIFSFPKYRYVRLYKKVSQIW